MKLSTALSVLYVFSSFSTTLSREIIIDPSEDDQEQFVKRTDERVRRHRDRGGLTPPLLYSQLATSWATNVGSEDTGPLLPSRIQRNANYAKSLSSLASSISSVESTISKSLSSLSSANALLSKSCSSANSKFQSSSSNYYKSLSSLQSKRRGRRSTRSVEDIIGFDEGKIVQTMMNGDTIQPTKSLGLVMQSQFA